MAVEEEEEVTDPQGDITDFDGFTEATDTAPIKVDPYAGMSFDELVKTKIQKESHYSLNRAEATHAYTSGYVSDSDLEDMAEKADSPTWWYVKDVLQGITHSGFKALSETVNTSAELAAGVADALEFGWVPRLALALGSGGEVGMEQAFDPEKSPSAAYHKEFKSAIKVGTKKVVDPALETTKPESGVGKGVSSFSQFLFAFVPTARALKGTTWATQLAQSGKWGKFISEMAVSNLAAIGSSVVAFDPYDKRISNFIVDSGYESEILKWMAANPDDTQATARFKVAVEEMTIGLGLDMGMEGMFKLLKFVKAKKWERAQYKAEIVAADIDKKYIREGSRKPEPDTDDAFFKSTQKESKEASDDAGERFEFTEEESSWKYGEDELAESGKKKIYKPISDWSKNKKKLLEGAEEMVETYKSRSIPVTIDPKTGKKVFDSKRTVMNFNKFNNMADDDGTFIKFIDGMGDMIQKDLDDNVIKGVSKHVDVDKWAKKWGFDMEKLESFYKDTENMDKRMRSMELYFTEYTHFMDKLPHETMADKVAYVTHIKHFGEVMARVAGVKTNVARGFGVQKMQKTYGKFNFETIPDEIFRKEHTQVDAGSLDKIIEGFIRHKKPQHKALFARQVGRADFIDMIVEYAVTGMLSATRTLERNALGALITGTLEVSTRMASLTLKGSYEFWKKDDLRHIESLYNYIGAFRLGAKDVFKFPEVATEWYKHPIKYYQDNPERFGTAIRAALTGEPVTDSMHKLGEGRIGAIPGKIGEVLRFFGLRGMTVQDEIVKGMLYQPNIYFDAFESGIQSGFHGTDLEKHVFDYVNDPSPVAHFKAMEMGRDATFSTPLEGMGKSVNQWLNSGGKKGDAWLLGLPHGPIVKLQFMPFWKMIYNLTKYTIDRSPLAVINETSVIIKNKSLTKRALKDSARTGEKIKPDLVESVSRLGRDWAAGGTRQYEAVVRIGMGSAIIGWAFHKVANGEIEGQAPSGLREAYRQAGYKENAFINKETGKVTEFRGADPIATWLSTTADVYNLGTMVHDYILDEQTMIDIGDITNHTLFTLSANLGNKTFLQGFQDAVNTLEKRTGTATKKYLMSSATKFIPLSGLTEQVASLMHDQQVEIYNAMDVIYTRIWKSKATPRYDAYGNAVMNDTRVGVTGAFRQTDIKRDPADYAFIDTGAKLTRLEHKHTISGFQIDLSKDEFMQVNENLSKLPAREAIRNFYLNVKGTGMPDREIATKLTSILSTFRRAALYQTLGEDVVLLKKYTDEIDKWVASLNTDTPLLNPDIAYSSSHRVLQELLKR